MNGIDKITSRITSDTEQEIAGLMERANREAAIITDSLREVAEAEYDEAVAKAQRNAKERAERLAGVARLDANKLVLAAKQQMLDRAFSQALIKLTELPQEQYISTLASLAADASYTGTEEIVLSPDDHERIGDKVEYAANARLKQAGKKAELVLSEQSRPMRGGLYLKNRNIEYNCTFETIIRLLREQLSGEVAKVLFD